MRKRVRYSAGSFTNFRMLLILLLAACMLLSLLPGCAKEEPDQAAPGHPNGQDPVKPPPDENPNNGQETNNGQEINNGRETYNEQAITREVSDLVESLVLKCDLEGFLLPVIEGGKFSLINPVIEGGKFSLINLAGEIVLASHSKVGIYDVFLFLVGAPCGRLLCTLTLTTPCFYLYPQHMDQKPSS